MAVADLQNAGVPPTDIDLIESEADARLPTDVVEDAAQPPAVAGATIGGGLGGALGVLIGIGSISAPFLGPVVRTGWVLPTVIGRGHRRNHRRGGRDGDEAGRDEPAGAFRRRGPAAGPMPGHAPHR